MGPQPGGPGPWVENQSSKVTRKPRFDFILQPSLRPPSFTRPGGLLSVGFGASAPLRAKCEALISLCFSQSHLLFPNSIE